ncbi:hypothetical protein Agabi119p4_10603 [Agaricus bisporus var. burnettii]|uniref:Uncharacterized protein n=1 Tax=Agaricus bisporus var. burnettii TaxID=192524 RepID=A0A8H7C408_AGABI|nr:hypothetical protein Agabi119p4_10603 [Agaricus bisporus var. burnettii]
MDDPTTSHNQNLCFRLAALYAHRIARSGGPPTRLLMLHLTLFKMNWSRTFSSGWQDAIFEDNHIDDTSMAADVHLDLDVLLPRKGVLGMTGKFCKIGLDMLSRPAFIMAELWVILSSCNKSK